MKKKLTITFDEATLAESNQFALELQSYLTANSEVDSKIENENSSTQDFGAVLAIILGSAAIEIIAQGISNWMVKKQERKITIKADGEIIGENLSSSDVNRILDTLK